MKHSTASQQRPASRGAAQTRNTHNPSDTALRAPAAPKPPVVAGKLLAGEAIGFLEFLADGACAKFCGVLFGGAGTSVGTMLSEFRKATKFPAYYYGRPGKLIDNAATNKLLKNFARRAYRGDPDRRGVVFWERVAWLLWSSYSALIALRGRAAKIRQQEIKRIANLPTKRVERAKYMRRYRAKRASERRAKAARYFKSEARERWRKRRLGLKS